MSRSPARLFLLCVGAGAAVGLAAGVIAGLFLGIAQGGVVDGAGYRALFVVNTAAVYALAGALVALVPAVLSLVAIALPALRRRAGTWVVAPALAGALVAAMVASQWVRVAPTRWNDAAVMGAALAAFTALALLRRWLTAWSRVAPLVVLVSGMVVGAVLLFAVRGGAETMDPAGEAAPEALAARMTAPAGPGSPTPRNLVLIVIDTLRADHLSCYGYARPTSPEMDRFAQSGVLFENAIVQRPKTSPSMASILAGTYPHTHGVASVRSWLPEEVLVLPEILQAAGWRTAAFVSNPNLYHDFNFHQGFDTFDEIGAWEKGMNDAARVNARALPWLAANHEEPFFLYVHYIDPHSPYDPPAPYRDRFRGDELDGRFRHLKPPIGKGHVGMLDESVLIEGRSTDIDLYVARYDEEILYVDAEVGRLLRTLDDLGLTSDTLVVLTSDHGESMTEHEVYFNHGLFPFENNTRVPLIFSYPPAVPAGRREAEVVESIDILPTVLDLLALPHPAGLEGVTLTGLLRGGGPRGRDTAYAEAGGSDPEGFLTAIRSGPWKLVFNPKGIDRARDPFRPELLLRARTLRSLWWAAHGGPGSNERWELFDLATDPGEMFNLVNRQPDVYRRLRADLEAWMRRWPEERESRIVPPEKVSPEMLERLRALGYAH